MNRLFSFCGRCGFNVISKKVQTCVSGLSVHAYATVYWNIDLNTTVSSGRTDTVQVFQNNSTCLPSVSRGSIIWMLKISNGSWIHKPSLWKPNCDCTGSRENKKRTRCSWKSFNEGETETAVLYLAARSQESL